MSWALELLILWENVFRLSWQEDKEDFMNVCCWNIQDSIDFFFQEKLFRKWFRGNHKCSFSFPFEKAYAWLCWQFRKRKKFSFLFYRKLLSFPSNKNRKLFCLTHKIFQKAKETHYTVSTFKLISFNCFRKRFDHSSMLGLCKDN